MGAYHRFIFCAAVLFVVALPSAARPGDDLTYYLDREAYLVALGEVDSAVARLLASGPRQSDRAHLENAARALGEVRAAFLGGEMIGSLRDVAQTAQHFERVAGTGQSAGALAAAETLALAAQRVGREVVQCIHAFSYLANPHIRNARQSLDRGDTELAARRLANACNLYRQALDKAKVVFEGKNLFRPGADEDERQIQATWNGYRDGLIRGDTNAAIAMVTEEFQERFALIFAGIEPDTLARITREMAPITPIEQLGPTLRWYNAPRYIPAIDRIIDFFVYFQQVDDGWKVAML
jgi:hypothetical protein